MVVWFISVRWCSTSRSQAYGIGVCELAFTRAHVVGLSCAGAESVSVAVVLGCVNRVWFAKDDW